MKIESIMRISNRKKALNQKEKKVKAYSLKNPHNKKNLNKKWINYRKKYN